MITNSIQPPKIEGSHSLSLRVLQDVANKAWGRSKIRVVRLHRTTDNGSSPVCKMPFDVELIERSRDDGSTEYLVTMEGGRVQMGNGVFVDVEGVEADDEFVIVPAAGAQLVLEVALTDANAATATLRVETPPKLITCKPTR